MVCEGSVAEGGDGEACGRAEGERAARMSSRLIYEGVFMKRAINERRT